MPRFDGVVKPVRRGGWSARGMITNVRAGQIIETQVGPREFDAREESTDWLYEAASEHAIQSVEIIVLSRGR